MNNNIDYKKYIEILKKYKDTFSRNSIDKWISHNNGIHAIIDKFGNLENLRLFLVDAGYQSKYTFRVIKGLKERLKFINQLPKEDK